MENKEQERDGPELQRRAELFKPWLEEPATQCYMDIVGRKIKSLERQLKAAPPETDNRVLSNIQGKIKALEEMSYLPIGAIKRYDGKVEKERKEKEKKLASQQA